MSSQSVRSELLRFDPEVPIERASMPPAAWYTEPAFYELERRSIFARTWQPVARAEQLAEPGDYLSGRFAGEPWVVTRDGQHELRAFYNVCRHKGREVVTGSGRSDALVCGYHAWCYGLDGRLRKAPRMAGIESFDKDAMSLQPMGVSQWGPWVFVNGDPAASPPQERFADLDAQLSRSPWHELTHVCDKVWVINCNWKVYIDNYLDGGYHVPHMHPSLGAQLDMQTYRTDVFAQCSIQTSRATADDATELDFDPKQRIGDGAIYGWVFPNFMINRYGPCLDTNYVEPLSHDRCRVHYQFYFLETEGESARRFIDESIAQADVTQREDIEICESVQAGLQSVSYDRGRYAPRVEIGEYHFHTLLAQQLRAAVEP